MREELIRCPKCRSGNIIGYRSEWECMDCGYRFALSSKAEKPTAAFVLSLLGGIITLFTGILLLTPLYFIGKLYASPIDVVMGILSGVVIIVGSALINSTERKRVRLGSFIVLIGALISIPFTFAGAIVGFVLCLVGAILGFLWKP